MDMLSGIVRLAVRRRVRWTLGWSLRPRLLSAELISSSAGDAFLLVGSFFLIFLSVYFQRANDQGFEGGVQANAFLLLMTVFLLLWKKGSSILLTRMGDRERGGQRREL
jgi:hypothetical protein